MITIADMELGGIKQVWQEIQEGQERQKFKCNKRNRKEI